MNQLQPINGFKLTPTARTALISAGFGVSGWAVARAFWPEYSTPIMIGSGAAGTIAGELYESWLQSEGMNGVGMSGGIAQVIVKVVAINNNNGLQEFAKKQAAVYNAIDPMRKAINDLTFSKYGDTINTKLYDQWKMNYFHKHERTVNTYAAEFEKVINDLLAAGKLLRVTENTWGYLKPLIENGLIRENQVYELTPMTDEQKRAALLLAHGGNYKFNSSSFISPVSSQASLGLLAVLVAAGFVYTKKRKEQ